MELDMEHGIHFCVCVRVRGACDHRCVCDGVISSRSLLYVLACRSMVLVRILSLFSLHIRPRVHARTRTYTYTYALTRTYVPVLTQAQHTRKKEPLYSALFCSALLWLVPVGQPFLSSACAPPPAQLRVHLLPRV